MARRVCSSLAQRGHEVQHVPGPDDDELRETLDGTSVRGIAILLQDDVDALRYAPMAAAHIHPSAPMMVTIFDRTIGDQLARFLPPMRCHLTCRSGRPVAGGSLHPARPVGGDPGGRPAAGHPHCRCGAG